MFSAPSPDRCVVDAVAVRYLDAQYSHDILSNPCASEPTGQVTIGYYVLDGSLLIMTDGEGASPRCFRQVPRWGVVLARKDHETIDRLIGHATAAAGGNKRRAARLLFDGFTAIVTNQPLVISVGEVKFAAMHLSGSTRILTKPRHRRAAGALCSRSRLPTIGFGSKRAR